MDDFWTILEHRIAVATGQSFGPCQRRSIGGGCINQAWRLGDGKQDYFVKINSAAGGAMFEAEAAGLVELADTATVRVPQPICHGVAGAQSYLVLEYLPLGRGTPPTMAMLGQQLAALHGPIQAFFGWHRDNTIGSTPQINKRYEDWIRFWREQRLGFQLELAAAQGYGGTLQRQGQELLARLEGLFVGYRPTPALLHGDLWSGNVAGLPGGQPVMFDPAVYYGDREVDLAMTELFGGFSERFYAAYREVLPFTAGYPQRRTLYNIYHILNHLNLFGGGYRHQADTLIATLLAELR